jgi:allantoinase
VNAAKDRAALSGLNVAFPGHPAALGYDHHWFEYQSVTERSARPWPGNRSVAVAVLVDARAAEWETAAPAVGVPGGRGTAPYPDYPRLSHREYGHRVGIWRLSGMLEELGVPWTAVLDVLTAEHYEAVLSLVLSQAKPVVAGGMSASRPITSRMVLAEERDYVESTLDRIQRATGTRPAAWMGPGWSQSTNTPRVLAEAGVELTLDWGNDELPYPIEAAPPLWAVPVSWESTPWRAKSIGRLGCCACTYILGSPVSRSVRGPCGRLSGDWQSDKTSGWPHPHRLPIMCEVRADVATTSDRLDQHRRHHRLSRAVPH